MNNLSIAIVDSNILAGIGLQQILEDIMPMADIQLFTTFEELAANKDSHFIHFFVASRIYFEHAQYFRENAKRSIVLVNGDMQINGVMTLNVCQQEKMLVKSILALHSTGHGPGHPGPTMKPGSMSMGHPAHATEHPDCTHPHAHLHAHPHAPLQAAQQQTEQLLSAREIEVAVLLSKGVINKEIADKLNISVTTVITHRTHIMEKLNAHSLADIIIHCVMNGFVDVGEL
ncbi:MAG: helix-turn-helix transcriptional regulator [Bacteroidaceae bacterium]|nr:helix-turn-helix transcriptional regulator [Bacteroidaceae bacterium]